MDTTRSDPSDTHRGQSRFSRRVLLRRAAVLGASAPLLGGLLAACGSSASNSSSTSSSSSASSSSSSSNAAAASASSSSASSAATASGSSASPNASPNASSYKIEPAAHKGGQMITATTADAATLNPILSHDTSSGALIGLIFEGLVQTDPTTAEPIGDAANSWEISADGITYTFLLNPGINWHDGQLMTSADVKFTYDLMLNPDTNSPRYTTMKEYFKSIDAPDDAHVVMTLNGPNSSVLANNMGYGIMPQHILQSVAPKALAQDTFSTGKKGRTIGTGPFMFQEWIKDDHSTLVKFPGYWRGEPNLDQWIYKVVPNQTVETEQLKTGEVDISGIQPSDYASLLKQSNITVSAYDTFSATFYCYQMDPAKNKVFQDKAVRQALLYALNRPQIVQAIDFGLSKVAIGTIPTLSWAYNPDGITLKYDYDVDTAKKLLDDAGWKPGADGIRVKNGLRLAFTVLTNSGSDVRQSYVTVFQQAWKEIGADATPKFIEWNAFLTTITSEKTFDIFFEGFSWGVDPDQTAWFACNQYPNGLNRGKY
ncbi:MAG TPA: ABC transporter substrate-binding protein, partial [Thermomicrobiaceae bacterium]|nr:ABC transporter substrate-binding protein [Thermomicrobiaceae bacterium]